MEHTGYELRVNRMGTDYLTGDADKVTDFHGAQRADLK